MSLQKLTKHPLTIGIGTPIDNYFSRVAQKKREIERIPFGVPDMSGHRKYITMVDKMGFNTIWLRDVPVYDPTFADAG